MAREHETTSETYLVTWTVEPGEAGMRLDVFLKAKYKYLSREFLQRNIKDGAITLNHKQTKPGQVLRVKDKVYVLSTKGNEPEVSFDFKIIYEDAHILVVEKPGNLPVHPSGRYFFHTLLTQLRVENGNEVDQRKEFYLVHRIDRETSGLLVIGKTSKAAAGLVSQFENREVDKEYLAIAAGHLEKDVFDVDAPMSKCRHSAIKLKMNVVELDQTGEPLFIPKSEVMMARTHFEVVERIPGFTIVKCRPHTGRQHQIRVHLWHVGHPIAGDKLYGPDDALFLRSMQEIVEMPLGHGLYLSRHALHAYRLSFKHPATGERMLFESPFPPELQSIVDSVKKAPATS